MRLPYWVKKYLLLDEAQQAKLQSWIEQLPKRTLEEMEESCTVDGRTYHVRFCDGGIATEITVYTNIRGREHRCDLTYDDDGEICES